MPSNSARVTVAVNAATTAAQVYLGDLNAISSTNGYGVYEKTRSNGEAGGADGKTITLNGKTYTKGLGCSMRRLVRKSSSATSASTTKSASAGR